MYEALLHNVETGHESKERSGLASSKYCSTARQNLDPPRAAYNVKMETFEDPEQLQKPARFLYRARQTACGVIYFCPQEQTCGKGEWRIVLPPALRNAYRPGTLLQQWRVLLPSLFIKTIKSALSAASVLSTSYVLPRSWNGGEEFACRPPGFLFRDTLGQEILGVCHITRANFYVPQWINSKFLCQSWAATLLLRKLLELEFRLY